MNAIPFHAVVISTMHINGLGLDDFICFGLIALALVIATFVVRGGEKVPEDKTAQAGPDRSANK